jgi:plastocyanin
MTAGATRRRAVRRGGAAAAALALAVLAVALASPVGGAAAEGGECEWRPHKVRVVKHVKRHGKRVKIVRKRVRWSCVPLPAAPAPPSTPAPTPAPPVTPPSVPAPPGEEPGNPHWFGAQAYEYGFEPSGPSFQVSAGADTIELINRGEDAHDLHLERKSNGEQLLEIAPTGPNGHARENITLEAGEYVIYCSLADHRTVHKMERTLIVTP